MIFLLKKIRYFVESRENMKLISNFLKTFFIDKILQV